MAFLKETLLQVQKTLPAGVGLIAASKTRSVEDILAAKEVGIRHFGENYVQEAEAKAAAVSGVVWHLIGPLQSNKVSKAMTVFDVFHTVDREKLLNKLDKAAGKENKNPDIFLQVNIGREPQKGGVMPEGLAELVDKTRNCENLNLVGLMAIPPADIDPAPSFAALRGMAEKFNLQRLSMGMSGDWEQALKEGATDIRLGTALFGARD